jgi:hypothetical protein
MITSFVPGRIRIRDASLKDPSLPLDGLRALQGVSQVDHNPRTGSVLVLYDPGSVDMDKAAELLSGVDPSILQAPADEPPPAWARPHRPSEATKTMNETVAMSLALAATLASGFVRSRKVHFMAGMFLVELVVEHLWRFRHRLGGR